MRSTFTLPTYPPWSATGYGLSSPALSDESCSDSSVFNPPRIEPGQEPFAQGYGSIVLGGEVYCPHQIKERRYEPPGLPPIGSPEYSRPSSYSSSYPRSENDLCDHCEAIAKSEVERFLSTLASLHPNFGPRKVQKIDPTRRMSQQDPPPCNTYYLKGKCATGTRCRYGHDYELNAAQIEEIRRGAKWHPCSAVQHGLECPDGEGCIYGHACPKGLNCRKPDCAFGPDVNAEIIDLHGYQPITLRELVWQNETRSTTVTNTPPPPNEYYQVQPRFPLISNSPYYEIVW
ncbi:hypothetical protein JCM5350_005267 [Sporobolomyces pararoseus]